MSPAPLGAPITRAALVATSPPGLTESFIRAHRDQLPADTLFLHGWPPMVDGRRVPLSRPERVYCQLRRRVLGGSDARQHAAEYVRALRRHRAQVVIAEYGHTSARVIGACQTAGVPLVAHFHGYDAHKRDMVAKWEAQYRALFRGAAAVVAVSRAMRHALIALGAPAERVYWNPCGAEVDWFAPHDPGTAPPVLVAVGRLVEKKGPTYTLRAFARALAAVPEARLRLLGAGPLDQECRALAAELGIAHAVEFMGGRPHAEVRDVMGGARAFVQHSVVAASGDSEGTPVSVLEAGASGLPVVSTRHAGIPDVVVDGVTGLLVAERDVDGMAAHMIAVLRDPARAARLGAAGRRHVVAHYSTALSVRRLWAITAGCARGAPPPAGDELVAPADA